MWAYLTSQTIASLELNMPRLLDQLVDHVSAILKNKEHYVERFS